MAKKKDRVNPNIVPIPDSDKLWEGISEEDFLNEENIEDIDIGEYNKEKMTLFAANVNYARHLPKRDGLKLVERRIMYSLFNTKAIPKDTSKAHKAATILGEVTKLHPHGDDATYKAMVYMAQYWKKNARYVNGIGNYGTMDNSEGFAAFRYTGALMSKYGYDCFFSDFDEDCVEMVPDSLQEGFEPVILPTKYPNILINGGTGIAFGNAFRIPPYYMLDVMEATKTLIKNPNAKVFMIPDPPTACQIIDDGRSLMEICETGSGILRMRGRIDIEEYKDSWGLIIKNIPWLTTLTAIKEKIVELSKAGVLQIKDVQDGSYAYFFNGNKNDQRNAINVKYIINKAYDPNVVRDILYKNTDLEKSVSVQFKIVADDFNVQDYSMRDLILSWIDERREYKRRLFNKRIVKISARISFLDLLIELTDKKNVEKLIGVIKKHNKSEAEKFLVSEYGMSTYQATKIADLTLFAFSKDARDDYIAELEKKRAQLKECMDIIKSEKKIDELILEELDGLWKYAEPRKCEVVEPDNGTVISETDHVMVITKKSLIKKLPVVNNGRTTTLGTFKQGDYPIHRLTLNNLDTMMLFDSKGKYTNIPVHQFPNTEPSNPGHMIFNFTKLEGEIVSVFPFVDSTVQSFLDEHNQKVSVLNVTKNGMGKRTPLEEFLNMKVIKNVRCIKLKDDDELRCAFLSLENVNLIVYTRDGYFSYINSKDISSMGRDTQGVQIIKLKGDDEVQGICSVGKKSEYIVVITEKGFGKLCEMEYLGEEMKRGQSSYITRINDNDKVLFCEAVREKETIRILTRNQFYDIPVTDIPVLSRRSLPHKVVPMPVGDNIINIQVLHPKK